MRWVRVLQDRPRSGASRCKSRREHAQVSIDELIKDHVVDAGGFPQ